MPIKSEQLKIQEYPPIFLEEAKNLAIGPPKIYPAVPSLVEEEVELLVHVEMQSVCPSGTDGRPESAVGMSRALPFEWGRSSPFLSSLGPK